MKRKQIAVFGSLLALAFLAGCSETSVSSEEPSSSQPSSSQPSSSQPTSSSQASSEEPSSSSSFDASQTIVPYTRDGTSGTRDGFMTTIGLESAKEDNGPLKSSCQEVSSNDNMISSLKADTYGIGYFSYDSVSSATADGSLQILSYEGVAASEESILDGTYGLSRNFNYCYRNETDSTKALIVSAFVAYMGTQEGLAIIANNGGTVSITASTPTWDSIKDQYEGISDDHSTVTIYFGGSTSVEKIAKALSSSFSSLAGNFVYNHNHTGSGAAVSGITDDAGTLDIGFASREFKSSETELMSSSQYGRVCVDGIVVAVSSANPLSNIRKQELYDIYAAESTNVNVWSDIIG